ncbi:IS1380 family transposase [Candidatus Poriferisodalis sp.]|uniref:IS1380 family transposase n=1 Tax=Candidatus Poriferisodalis sp. TaxID=3101277 RepID=UPI003C6FE14B
MTNARLAGGGDRVVWGAGLFALGGFADRVGLTEALSAAVPRRGERAPVHDRGRLLTHLLLVLAGGGEACTDIEHLRSQRELFGAVGSDSTLYRALRGIDASALGGLWAAAAEARERVWSQRRGSGPLVVDIDSTLVEVHSPNKAGAAAHFKGGYGFHPMICSTADGEPLWAKLRPGNAAANSIADHVEVLDAAISVLPDADAAGHRAGDDLALAGREMVLRLDSGGCSARIAAACRGRNVTFFMSARATAGIDAAIAAARCDPGRWTPGVPNPKQRHPKAHVAELTDLVDLSGWPARTRLIIRREPLHPGAQRSLFASENFRYWGFLTDAAGSPARLDRLMRKHADVEDAIARLKDSGLARMPFTAWDANCAWAALCMISAALVHWFQTQRLAGPLKRAAPKRLRWQLWHLPALVCETGRRTWLRLPTAHPGTRSLLAAQHPN